MPSILTLRRTIGDQSVTEAEGRLAAAVGVRGAGEVVAPPSEGITTLATVNWTNGLGTSTFAWTDGVTSRNVLCQPETTVFPTVLAAADEGWTGPGNVLRMQNTTGGCGGLLLTDVYPSNPQDGDVWVLRWSYKQSTDQIYAHNHTIVGFSPGLAGEGKLVLGTPGANVGGNWNHSMGLAPGDFGWTMRAAGNPGTLIYLTGNAWHRFEMAIRWHGQDSEHVYYRLYPRVYDPSGTLVATEANYYSEFLLGSPSNFFLSEYYANGGFLRGPISWLTNTNLDHRIRSFYVGISQSKATDQGFLYWAGVNVGQADTITYYGAY